jgi:radical SAM superfamily enzyme YgiQ (UPF0313 family)
LTSAGTYLRLREKRNTRLGWGPTLKILLISPGRGKKKAKGISGRAFQVPPLALGILASLTPEEHEIELVDENLHDLDFSEIPDLVAITCLTASAPRAYEISKRFRALGSTVVLGGIHPSAVPLESIQHADCIVLGEAEGVWPRLLEDFTSGQLKRFYKGKKPGPSQMSVPRRDIFESQGYFLKGTVQTSRGCPFGCDFCSVQRFFGNKFRFRSVSSVVDEVRSLATRFVAFVDDNIAGSYPYARELFASLAPLNVKWICQAPISIGKDRDFLNLMYKGGCRGVFVGFESILPDSLKEVGKRCNVVEKFYDYIKRIHDSGISIEGAFVFGFDHDDKSVFERTLEFINKAKIDFAQFGILTPFPGTKLQQRLRRQKRIVSTDWEKYDITHAVFRPSRMTLDELEEGRRWIENEFYSFKGTVRRMFGLGRRVRYLLPMFILNTSYRQYIQAFR